MVLIVLKTQRIIKKGGYLFLTVPSMSILRQAKAALNMYPPIEDIELIEEEFFQFAFSHKNVINYFTERGFKFVAHKPTGGAKGLKDEVMVIQKPLVKLYNNKLLGRVSKKLINIIVRKIANHMSLFIFVKK